MDAKAKHLVDSWIGLKLNGWLVEKYIDSGKSAHVFKGQKDGQVAAIKIFDPEIIEKFGEKEEEERIIRECELIGVNHDHLVRIFDGGRDVHHNLFFIVMEFIDAPNLARALAEVPPESVHRIICQLASAAKFLHERGILHRDIKPDNVAITSDFQRAILLDLGVIRPIDDSKTAILTDREKKVFVGTLQYSSPEYLLRKEESGEPGALAITFYQLGAVLHDLLMKKRIFADQADPYARLVQSVLNETPAIDSVGRPSQLVSLARNCLVKSPQLRLKLVSWNDFCPPAVLDLTALAKERIRKSKILATSELPVEETDSEELMNKRSAQLARFLDSIEDMVREECQKGELPPRSIESLPDSDCISGTVRVNFKPAYRAGLKVNLTIHLKLTVLDYAAQAILIECSALADGHFIQEQIEAIALVSLFSGVFDEGAIRNALAKVIYLVVADTMELYPGCGPTRLTISI